jgi:hypothetical protein
MSENAQFSESKRQTVEKPLILIYQSCGAEKCEECKQTCDGTAGPEKPYVATVH